jgi:hypothetical protein
MKTGIVIAATLAAAAGASAVPHGLAGPSVGFGGLLGDMGFVGGEYDYAKPPYFGYGPEAMLAFGGGGVGILAGGEARIYIIPNYNYLAQPYFQFGGGFGAIFTGDGDGGLGQPQPADGGGDTHVGGYIHFGVGNDFDIPDTIMVPYIDLGGLVFISDKTDAVFKIEIGMRFNTR